jgi:hypothetical protein
VDSHRTLRQVAPGLYRLLERQVDLAAASRSGDR